MRSLIPAAGTRRPALLVLLAAVAGCAGPGGGYYGGDGPPGAVPVDLDRVADAVPRPEPPSASGNKPYVVAGRSYVPMSRADGYRERGVASWYGTKFHGRLTSSGEPYDMYAMTAAHRTLPLPVYVRVRNLQNGREVVVRVNDRGPFHSDRLIDLSYAAAHRLGILATGTGLVEVEALSPAAAGGVRPAPPAGPAPAGDPPRLYLQLGAFVERRNAEELRRRLLGGRLDRIFIDTVAGAAGPMYRVRIGPLASPAEGDRIIARVARLGINGSRLVVE